MATPANITLLFPFVVIENGSVTGINLNQTQNVGQGTVRQTYGFASVVTEGDLVAYKTDGQIVMKQDIYNFSVVDERNVLFVYAVIAAP